MRYAKKARFMISQFNELHKLFEEIDKALEGKACFFVIGGAMMLYHGMKSATKDIDIIVETVKEFRDVEIALRKLNFTAKIPPVQFRNLDLSQMFIREDFRIDLFQRTVCKGFVLSDAMMKRAKKIIDFNNLTILLCSMEDVFVLKTFTEREGDIEDCISLAQRGLDWDAILGEIKRQIKISGKNVWITWIGERLDVLEERGLQMPIMAEVNRLRKEYFAQYENAK